LPSLKAYNTLGLDVSCNELIRIKSSDQLQEIVNSRKEDYFILGGGSNVLILNNLNRPVLLNQIKDREVIKETKSHSIVKIGGGENWHKLVRWTIKQGLGGLENLSLIPGSVGAAPMQNIGAYGVEIKDVFHSLEAINLKSGKKRTFKSGTCEFGYRSSVFKNKYKGKYFITSVSFKLSKNPKLNISYGAIKSELEKRAIHKPTIKDVSDVVIDIRNTKLPDPKVIGNTGSFFKNPIVSSAKAKKIKRDFPNMPSYPATKTKVKLSAGWLIEKCGWKGKNLGGAGCYAKHALILINKNNATSDEMLQLSQQIQESVKEKFGLKLEAEVNFIS
jgi:UDP-N-acetylmuramate dehydrogenase